MLNPDFDVIISGGGPAGSACAIQLAESGLKVCLIDKAIFPRDKTCGDALSVDVINQLEMLSPALLTNFYNLENKIPSYGVKIFSPNHNSIDIPFIYNYKKSCGFISPRLDFDQLLFEYAKQTPGITSFENCELKQVEVTDNNVIATTTDGTITASLIAGADGAHSIVAKSLSDIAVDKAHYSAGLRVYYEGVTNFHKENFIELHFFKDILPGYLWIFPLANNRANVGIGMLSSTVAEKKVNLRETLKNLLATKPHLAERFKDAKPLETIKGYGLPLGSTKRNISGNRFLLLGDAAGLIDPFSGEGIANAIRSGRVAATHIKECFAQQNFSAAFNKNYDKEIYRRMWNEFKISRKLQYLVRFPTLFNFAIAKASKSKYLQQFFIEALANVEKKEKLLLKPAFYYRMLFK